MELGNILITGSHGFIGTHLCEELNRLDIRFTSFQGDLSSISDIESNFSAKEFDSIIHLAGVYAGDLQAQMKGNVERTANLLEVASRRGVRKIIFASSGAVYGNTAGTYSREDDFLEPNTEYGYTKKIAEEVILGYSKFACVTSIILRFPNVYGPGSRGVISTFSNSIKEKGVIYLSGNGEQLRNYLHVSDAVTALVKALGYERTDIFNITNPISMSLLEVIDCFSQSYQFDIVRKDDGNSLKNLLLDHEKAAKILDFHAQHQKLSIS